MQTQAPSHTPAATAPASQPDAPPRIYSVAMSSSVSSGQIASGVVTTSVNVASVEARIGGYGASAAKTGVGRFSLSYKLPELPFFLKGRTYTLHVIARNTRGDATERDLPVTVR